MNLSDKIINYAFWIALPSLRLTEGSNSKTIRILGFLGIFLNPIGLVIASLFYFIAMFIAILEEI